MSYLSLAGARSQPAVGPEEHLSRSGDNLANVVQYLQEQHPDRLEHTLEALRRSVPQLNDVWIAVMPDGRLLLQVKDAPFDNPVQARFVSDGTLKLLAYQVLLHDPAPPPFIGIEEPENFLYPTLLAGLAEECRAAAERTQLLVTTHSPFFVDQLRPGEVWMLRRDASGFTQARRARDLPGVEQFLEDGGKLGQLWMEGHLGTGDPPIYPNWPTRPEQGRPH